MRKSFNDSSDYVAKGDSPLTPWELIDIRNYLLRSGSLWDFQFWTMILVACKLFLREDELSSLSFGSIDKSLSVVDESGSVHGLAVVIKGKSDSKPVTLMLWGDDDVPELCPVRHLLAFLSMLGSRSGYFFPDYATNSSMSSSHVSSPIAYSTFQEKFKTLCRKFIPRAWSIWIFLELPPF